MSDFSTLYKKYNSISNLTNDLNNSVIVLKRRNIMTDPANKANYPKLDVQDTEVFKANKDIALILSHLENFYNNQDTRNSLYELMVNPLFRNNILDNMEYREHILQSLKKLQEDQALSEEELSSIDRFVSILDNEASVLYRKLRSTRG